MEGAIGLKSYVYAKVDVNAAREEGIELTDVSDAYPAMESMFQKKGIQGALWWSCSVLVA